MELLAVLCAVAALFFFCAVLTLKLHIPASAAPLTALGCLAAVLTLAGIANLLYPTLWVLYLLCLAGGVWALWQGGADGLRHRAKELFCPATVLFWAAVLGFAVYFFVRQPLCTGYDELSLWATAVKTTTVSHRLHTTVELGTPWAATQNAGLPLLSYFFQFFGRYADWKIYLAYNVLYFAVYAAVLGALPWKSWRTAVPAAAVLWFVPYFFTTYNHTLYLSTVYMSCYGDIPAGMVFGGAVALWLNLRGQDAPRWPVFPVLALAANIKANDFVLSLVAAGLVAVDAWLFAEGPFQKGLARRTGFAVGCLAAPMAVYYIWNVRYISWVVAQKSLESGVGETSQPLAAVVVNGIRMLLGKPVPDYYAAREEQFRTAMAQMGQQFWTSAGKLSMIGQGRNIAALILLVFAAAIVVAGSRLLRARIAAMGVLSLVCFGGYNLELALSYGFIFKASQAASLVDYNRYIYSYYIGWFVLALGCLLTALRTQIAVRQVSQPDGPTAVFLTTRTAPKHELAGQGVLLLLAAGMLLRSNQLILPQLSVLGFSDSEFTDRRNARQEAALVSSYLSADDRVFFVHQGEDGQDWFAAVFDFYPILVDYSGDTAGMNGGGGTLGLAELNPADGGLESRYYHAYTAEELADVIARNGCTVLYLQHIDDIFVKSYAELFTDGLAAAQNGSTLLYRVTPTGYTPMQMEVNGA